MAFNFKDIMAGRVTRTQIEDANYGISSVDGETKVRRGNVKALFEGTAYIVFNVLGEMTKSKDEDTSAVYYKTYGNYLGPRKNSENDNEHYGLAIVMAIDTTNKDKNLIPINSDTLTKTYQEGLGDFNSKLPEDQRLARFDNLFVKLTDDDGPVASQIYKTRQRFGQPMQVHAQVRITNMWWEEYKSKAIHEDLNEATNTRENRLSLYIKVQLLDATIYGMNEPNTIHDTDKYKNVFQDIVDNAVKTEPISPKDMMSRVRHKRWSAKQTTGTKTRTGMSTTIGAAQEAANEELVQTEKNETVVGNMQENRSRSIKRTLDDEE